MPVTVYVPRTRHLPRCGLRDSPFENNRTLYSFEPLVQVDFELYGDVQGFFFRRYAKDKAAELNVTGWMKCSRKGVVVGQLQGNKDKINAMVKWLTTQGAPGSNVERVDLKHWQFIDTISIHDFLLRF